MSDSVVSNHFLSSTYMSASYRRATRLARWNKKPSESSVRRARNHTLQQTAASRFFIAAPRGRHPEGEARKRLHGENCAELFGI
jgi:hypothetical protein